MPPTVGPGRFGDRRSVPVDTGAMTSTDGAAALAGLAALLADRSRAAICLALLDGRAWTAGELAAHVGVAPSTTTEHLHRLVAGGVLAEERQGRHRYVRLAMPQLVEDLVAVTGAPAPAGGGGAPAGSLRRSTASAALARGRTCYDHLAGRLGVAVTDAMTARGLLDQAGGFALTPDGRGWLRSLLGEDPLGAAGRRPLARACLDWTERRPHLAGVAGARLCAHAFERDWLLRIGTGRAVRLTPAGASALGAELGLDGEALGAA
jgi:DNA-binding transcriptional ArsR family regulator